MSDPASAAPGVFESVAFLFAPPNHDRRHRAIEAHDWAVDTGLLEDADVVLWGRRPLNPEVDRDPPRPFALRREVACARLRLSPPAGLAVFGVHRWRPPRWRGGVARNAARNALFGGVLVALARGRPSTTVIDTVARAAGARSGASFRPNLEGYALGRLTRADGAPVQMRVAQAGHPNDPARVVDALDLLARVDVPLVPRLVASGTTSGASWTTETVLPGRIPTRLTPSLRTGVVRLFARLPRVSGPATSLEERLGAVARAFPAWSELAGTLAASVRARVESVPAVLQHGDLWSGNLLQEGGTLTGVVDWDCYHAQGLPGVDLLQLLIAEIEARTGGSWPDVWRSRPWSTEEYRALTREYWSALDIEPDDALLEAVALDCWASRVARVLERQAHVSRIPRWIRGNVDAVLEDIDRRRS